MSVARVKELHDAVDNIQKTVNIKNQRTRTKSQQIHNSNTGDIPQSFHVGDFVLIHTANGHRRSLRIRWSGPMYIQRAKPALVFILEDLYITKTITVHTKQITPYPDQQSTQPIESRLSKHAKYLDASLQIVNTLHDVRIREGEYEN